MNEREKKEHSSLPPVRIPNAHSSDPILICMSELRQTAS